MSARTRLHRFVEVFVTSAIVANIPIAAWAEITHDELAERIDLSVLVFFALEIGVRIVYACSRRRCESTLVLDAVIVAIALSGLPLMRAARLAHLSRHVHVFFARVARPMRRGEI